MDASLGIDEGSLVHNTQELMERVLAIQKQFGDAALAEEYIEGREFYVGVLGNQEPIVFPPIEMDFSGLPDGSLKIMDNEAKFDDIERALIKARGPSSPSFRRSWRQS